MGHPRDSDYFDFTAAVVVEVVATFIAAGGSDGGRLFFTSSFSFYALYNSRYRRYMRVKVSWNRIPPKAYYHAHHHITYIRSYLNVTPQH